MSTFIKICGLRDAADVAAATDAGATAVGFRICRVSATSDTGTGEGCN